MFDICWINLTEKARNNIPYKVFVHKNCWRDYTNPLWKKQKQNIIDDNCVKSTIVQSERNIFKLKTHCFFCGEVCVVDKKHPNHKVSTLSFQTSVLNKCHERADKWADDVLRWLSSSIDLVASDAIYHGKCESNFWRKNVYLQQRGHKLNTRLGTP